MTVTKNDVTRVAAAIRTAGELFEVHGALMLDLTDDWASGAKAANLDPNSRGNRVEDGEMVPNDPTGEAAIHARAELHPQLQACLTRMVADAQWLRDMAHVLAPIVPPSTMNEKDERWCSHHLRIGLCEPRHRRDLCRFCSDFMNLWRVAPPVALLRERQQGKRLTEATIKAALEADGVIIQEVGTVSKAIRTARGRTGRPNQNQKKAG